MKNFNHKIKFNLVLVSTVFLLSSCSLIEGLWTMMCDLAPETDHCYQFIAIQSNSPEACENIKWTNFKDMWSNPPKDKCYMQIAINSWDESICNKMKWWMMSYTSDECKWETRTKIVKTVDEQLAQLDKDLEYSIWYTETEALLKKKKELEAKLRETFENIYWQIPMPQIKMTTVNYRRA